MTGRIKNVCPKIYNGIRFRSKLEADVAKVLSSLNINYKYEEVILTINDNFYYFDELQRKITYKPDFIIGDLIVECKGFETPEWRLKKKYILQYLLRTKEYKFYQVKSIQDLHKVIDDNMEMFSYIIAVYQEKKDSLESVGKYNSLKEALKDLGLEGKHTGNILSCLAGTRPRAFKYVWKWETSEFRSLDEEIWKPVVGYETLYKVSNYGRVVSTQFHGREGCKLMSQITGHGGYKFAKIRDWKRNIAVTYPVHRLVAEAFIPNPNNKPYVDHIDTVITNNNVSNLRWVTSYENSHNPITLERISKNIIEYNKSEKHKKDTSEAISIPVEVYNKEGTLIGDYPSMSIAAGCCNVALASVWSVCHGKTKQCKGMIFKLKSKT